MMFGNDIRRYSARHDKDQLEFETRRYLSATKTLIDSLSEAKKFTCQFAVLLLMLWLSPIALVAQSDLCSRRRSSRNSPRGTCTGPSRIRPGP